MYISDKTIKMLKKDANISFVRGNTYSIGIKLSKLGQELDKATLTCKANWDDKKSIFKKELNKGITLSRHTNDGDYYYVVRIAPEDTEIMEIGKYYYDLQIEVNGDVETIMSGVLDLTKDITRKGED